MINIMNLVKQPVNDEVERCLDPQLWHACAGGMVQMPKVNSIVFYFPQGHAEHTNRNVDFGNFPRIPPLILSRVQSVKYLADNETDEVYAKIRLIHVRDTECDAEDDCNKGQDKSDSFAKTLTQSDANNGGGFSVPRYCAETIFPRLDYSAEPPVQTILAKDVHGIVWKFRHIYRGTPRRHLLTTGWSNFVNQKKLVAGDSIVFLRAEDGDLYVGIRRAKRGMDGPRAPCGWNPGGGSCNPSMYQSTPGYLAEEDRQGRMQDLTVGHSFHHPQYGGGDGKVKAESVLEAARLAASGQSFEVVFYPRAGTPEFVVKASAVGAAMRVQWCSGMRFKMPFETEDSSRISWFMGTISSVQVEDLVHWPNSPWCLLEVAWDEPELLQNVKRVSPWLVELVNNMPAIHHLSSFSPPMKKLRCPEPPYFPLVRQFPMSSTFSDHTSPTSPLRCLSDTIPAGIQRARHAQFGFPSSELRVNKLQASVLPLGFRQQLEQPSPPPKISSSSLLASCGNDEDVSCLLTMSSSSPSSKTIKDTKEAKFLLFGKPILTEEQISQSTSEDTVGRDKIINPSDGSGSTILQNGPSEKSSDEVFLWFRERKSQFGLEIDQCKVFIELGDTKSYTTIPSPMRQQ
ncbi:hypothetical protein Leryth_009826 [Lithospermum erythrorhizon]|nr:hypothetical protein Leryth_009826 [Lithospermum erythrorhizon]